LEFTLKSQNVPNEANVLKRSPAFEDYSKFVETWGRTEARPFFTIITVCLNRAKTIESALASVSGQVFKDYELIVIDGGSTDGTLEILKNWSKQITKMVVDKDSGIYDAFNRGIVVSSGRWICFVNSDDKLTADSLAIAKSCIESDPATEILCGRTRFVGADGASMIFESRPDLLEQESTVGHNAAFVRRDVHQRVGLYRTDLRLASDYDFFLRCETQGVKFKAIPDVLVEMGAGGASDKHWVKLQAEIAQVQREVLQQSWLADLRQAKRLIRGFAARTLNALGLKPLVSWYRRNFALVKKI
jgi:glycosyltransferase involved in cell wall biosynthesis